MSVKVVTLYVNMHCSLRLVRSKLLGAFAVFARRYVSILTVQTYKEELMPHADVTEIIACNLSRSSSNTRSHPNQNYIFKLITRRHLFCVD